VTLRVALLHHDDAAEAGRIVRDVATGLRERGHTPVVIGSHRAPTQRSVEDGIAVVRVSCLPEGALRKRGFTGPLTHLPLALRTLHGGDFDLVHAFTAVDAAAALRWRRATGRPVVFTCGETIDRARVASARLRLRLLSAAIEDSDALVAPSEPAREALRYWMAADAQTIAPNDGAGHERLYRGTLSRTRRAGLRTDVAAPDNPRQATGTVGA